MPQPILDSKLEGNFGSQVKSNALFVQSACNMRILMEHYIKKQQRDFVSTTAQMVLR